MWLLMLILKLFIVGVDSVSLLLVLELHLTWCIFVVECTLSFGWYSLSVSFIMLSKLMFVDGNRSLFVLVLRAAPGDVGRCLLLELKDILFKLFLVFDDDSAFVVWRIILLYVLIDDWKFEDIVFKCSGGFVDNLNLFLRFILVFSSFLLLV